MGKEHSEETRAAVIAALLAGQSVSAAAREYEVPKGTVSRWKKQSKSFIETGVPSERTQKKDGRIGDLVVSYLEASLQSLRNQVDAFGDKEWLKEQSASELAVLHGVQMDKAARLLELLGASDDTAPDS